MFKNEWLKKLLLCPLLVVLSALTIAAYGALHNVVIFAFAEHYSGGGGAMQAKYTDLPPLLAAALDGWFLVHKFSLHASAILSVCAIFAPAAKHLTRLLFQAVGLLIITSLFVETIVFTAYGDWLIERVLRIDPTVDRGEETNSFLSFWALRGSQVAGILVGTVCGCIFLICKVVQLRRTV